MIFSLPWEGEVGGLTPSVVQGDMEVEVDSTATLTEEVSHSDFGGDALFRQCFSFLVDDRCLNIPANFIMSYIRTNSTVLNQDPIIYMPILC